MIPFAVDSHLYTIFFTTYMLLPTSIISALFSCRIQSCIGDSYSVDCCLCWGRQRMRIGFPQQKERVALMFSTCQRSSPLCFSLTRSLSVTVTCLSLFLLLTRHFFWCWSCFFLSAMQWLLCIQLSAVTRVLEGLWGEEKKKDLGSLLGSCSQFGLEGNLGHAMMWQNKKSLKFTGFHLCNNWNTGINSQSFITRRYVTVFCVDIWLHINTHFFPFLSQWCIFQPLYL